MLWSDLSGNIGTAAQTITLTKKKDHMDVISFAVRAIDTLKSIDSKCTRLLPLACASNVRCGHGSLLAKVILMMSLGTLLKF
jgi:hypothetical protein